MKKVYKYAGSWLLIMLPFVLALFNGNCLKFLIAIFFVTCPFPGPGIDFTDSESYHSGGELHITSNSRVYLSESYCSNVSLLATIAGATRLNDVVSGFWNRYNLVTGDGGIIARSSPDSLPWTTVNSGTAQNLNKMCVVAVFPRDYIYAVGDSGTVIYSFDSGWTWSPKNFPVSVNLNDIECNLNDTNNIRVVGDGNTSYYTTNGGATWIDDSLDSKLADNVIPGVDLSRGGPDLNSIHFSDDNTGYIAGEFGIIFKTTNGGANFRASFIPGIGSITDMHFITADSGFLVSDMGQVRVTDNGGMNWYNDTAASNLFGGSRINSISSRGEWGTVNANDGKYFIAARDSLSILSSIEPVSSGVPGVFSLYQNFPNPFNPVTNIRFSLVRAGDVSLTIYDVTGREVSTLLNERKAPGDYVVSFSGSGLASGIYFYSLTAGGFRETRKMMLIK